MWPFKKKVVEKTKQELQFKLPTPEEILNGADPWYIGKKEYNYKEYKEVYIINVFRYDLSYWDDLASCSDVIIGVDKKEFRRMMVEHFGAINANYYIIFLNLEQAKKVLEEFRPYYESFHLPRALMERMSCYCEGGYPPYFKSNLEKMDISNIKSNKNVKILKLRRA